MVFPIVPIVSTGFFTTGGAVALLSPFCDRESDSHEESRAAEIESSLSDPLNTVISRTDNIERETSIEENESPSGKQQVEILESQNISEVEGLRENLYADDLFEDMNDILSINLYELAKLKRWNDIIQRSKQKPKHYTRSRGCDSIIFLMKEKHRSSQIQEIIQNALFESCIHDAPVEVISALLQMSPNPRGLLTYQKNVTKSTPLHIACYAGANLQVIQLLIDSCPDVVLRRNGIGWTPLHLLCWGTDDDEIAERRKEPNREFNIAKMLLLIHPQQQRSQIELHYSQCHPPELISRRKAASTILMQDKIGWTPLHLACWGGASFDLIDLLLKSKKESAAIRTKDGWTPIHLACRYSASIEVVKVLLDAAPQSVSIKAKGGWCPLHLACWWKSSSQVIRAILKEYPFAAQIETWEDYKPIEILWQRYLESFSQKKNLGGLPTTNINAKDTSSNVEYTSISSIDSNMELCENISLLLHAARFREISEFTMQRNGPLSLIHAISAIASNIKCPTQVKLFILYNLSKITENEAKSPAGGNDRTLLSIAIDSGATWYCGLQIIFKAFPEAVSIRDTQTGLFPFMQAVVLPTQIVSIDTIYNLIRAAPELV